MSDIIGFVISIALIYIGLKIAFKFLKWIGILLIIVFLLHMLGII